MCGARLRFGHADSTYRRMAKDNARDALVVKVATLHTTVQTVGKSPASGNGNRRQRQAASDIAECEEPTSMNWRQRQDTLVGPDSVMR